MGTTGAFIIVEDTSDVGGDHVTTPMSRVRCVATGQPQVTRNHHLSPSLHPRSGKLIPITDQRICKILFLERILQKVSNVYSMMMVVNFRNFTQILFPLSSCLLLLTTSSHSQTQGNIFHKEEEEEINHPRQERIQNETSIFQRSTRPGIQQCQAQGLVFCH